MTGCVSASSGSMTITGSPTSFILPSLDEATEYVITIKAKNTAGLSPASNSFVGTTLAAGYSEMNQVMSNNDTRFLVPQFPAAVFPHQYLSL